MELDRGIDPAHLLHHALPPVISSSSPPIRRKSHAAAAVATSIPFWSGSLNPLISEKPDCQTSPSFKLAGSHNSGMNSPGDFQPAGVFGSASDGP